MFCADEDVDEQVLEAEGAANVAPLAAILVINSRRRLCLCLCACACFADKRR